MRFLEPDLPLPTGKAQGSIYTALGELRAALCGKHTLWNRHAWETRTLERACVGNAHSAEVHTPVSQLI